MLLFFPPISKKITLSEKNDKYFVGNIDDDKITPLTIMLPKTSAYVKSYDGGTKWMYFLIEDEELLKKHNDIWNRVSNNVKKEFDTETIYNKKFLKTKIKYCGDETTNFHDKEIPKEGSNYRCFLKKDEIYYPQVLLNECSYIEKKKGITYISDDLEIFSDDSSKNRLKLNIATMSFLRQQF